MLMIGFHHKVKMSADLKKEVEKKKQRLEELRRRKVDKDRVVAAKESLKKPAEEVPGTQRKAREELDDFVNDLIGPPTARGGKVPVAKAEVKPDEPIAAPVVVGKRKAVKLVIDHQTPVTIKPKELTVYDKLIQTDLPYEPPGRTDGEEDEDEDAYLEQTSVVAEVKRTAEEALKSHEDAQPQEEDVPNKHVLTDEERDSILQSDSFQGFLDRASRTVERALAEPSWLFIEELFPEGEELNRGPSVGTAVTQRLVLSNDRWTRGRVVTHIDWSEAHKELLLASYTRSEESSSDADGLVLLWNTQLQKSLPEYVLETQSSVLSASFAKFHPSYIVGGTYSGQVVLWDIRSNKRTPVQRSPLSGATHTHPVFCLRVVGTQNAHNLVTLSTDGRLCSWSVDMLSQPQETLELQNKSARPVAATCMDFADNEVSRLVVGSEECDAYLTQRHGSKSGVSLTYPGHRGPITGISLNKAHGQPDFSHLFLTSSFDWTVKLWSLKLQNEQQLAAKTSSPLCSFSMYTDYVNCVQWCPKHPAVFASGNGSGKMAIWNLNHDFEEPVVTEQLDSNINTLNFTASGQFIATGDDAGKISIFELGEGLYQPHPDEWTRLQTRLLAIPELSTFDNTIGSLTDAAS
uniref:Cytoplasmic dynein 1 intermediate chain n=1 Tax=Halisarca dujardinii TaxID=2583056 RepID=A0A9F1UCS7_HALDU|nr:cytoplasmic dynein 1 intermediate chain [Halisarca dujardinii]